MEEKIKAIIAEYKEMDISEIKSDVLFTDMDFDSLDLAELIMKLEDEFGVSLEIPEGTNTIQKLAEYIQSLKYGSVIERVEPFHVEKIPVYIPDKEIINEVNRLISEHIELEYKAYKKEQEAVNLIETEIDSWQN